MMNLAEKLDQHAVRQELGTIEGRDGAVFVVDTSQGPCRASRAASCLLEPAEGDRVLCAITATGRAWVLAVLDRTEGTASRLATAGDLELRVGGRFSVASGQGVDLCTSQDLRVTAREVNVNAIDGSVVLQRLTYLGRFLQSEVEKVKTIAGTFDAVLGRFSQRVQRSYRRVEEYDCVKAKQIDYVAESTLSLHGETAMVTAAELVKIDGSQVHVG
jgi:hypothetical protein